MLGGKYINETISYGDLGSGSEQICKIGNQCKVRGQILGYVIVLGYRRYIIGTYISREECSTDSLDAVASNQYPT